MVQSKLARQEPWGLAENAWQTSLGLLAPSSFRTQMGEMADVDEVGMSLGAEISPRVGLKGTGSKGREAEIALLNNRKQKQ